MRRIGLAVVLAVILSLAHQTGAQQPKIPRPTEVSMGRIQNSAAFEEYVLLEFPSLEQAKSIGRAHSLPVQGG